MILGTARLLAALGFAATAAWAGAEPVRPRWGEAREAALGAAREGTSDYIVFDAGRTGFGGFGVPYDLRFTDGEFRARGGILDLGAADPGAWEPARMDERAAATTGHVYAVRTAKGDYYRVTVKEASDARVTFAYARATSMAADGGGATPSSASAPPPAVPAPPSPPIAAEAARGDGTITVVLRTGDGLPDGSGRVDIVTSPVINNEGLVAAGVVLAPKAPGARREYALVAGAPGRLAVVARSGSVLPGGIGFATPPPADEIGPFRGVPRLNDRGTVAFLATYDPGRSKVYASQAGIFTASAKVAADGDASPDRPGRRFYFDVQTANPPSLGSDDTLAFGTTLEGEGFRQGPDADAGLYAGPPGRLRALAHRGEAVPGGGARFASPSAEDPLGFAPPGIGPTGVIAFVAHQKLERPAADGAFDSGFRDVLYRTSADGLQRLLGSGDPAPDGDGVLDSFFDVKRAPSVNRDGVVALLAQAHGDPMVVVAGGAKPQVAARTGRPAPGGGTYSHLAWQPSIDDRGRVAFAARLREGTLSDAEAVFAGAPGDLRCIARTGGPLPERGGIFAAFASGSAVGHLPNFNRQGRLAFVAEARLDDGKVVPGLYAHDGASLWKVVRGGDTLEGKRVREIGFNAAVCPGVRGMNDDGRIAFAVVFEDGTGAICVARP